jgi:opacity protein-like surface antigen
MGRFKLLSMAVVLGIAGAAWAQETESGEAVIGEGDNILTGFLGGQFFDLAENFENFGNEVENHLAYGIRYQYQITPRVGLEAGLLLSPTEHQLFTANGGILGARDVGTSYWTANGVYHFRPVRRILPFVTGGIGAARLSIDDPGLEDSETNFLWNFGGGVLFPAADNFWLRVDARDYIYSLDDLGPEFSAGLRLPGGFDETVNDFSLSFGASFVF